MKLERRELRVSVLGKIDEHDLFFLDLLGSLLESASQVFNVRLECFFLVLLKVLWRSASSSYSRLVVVCRYLREALNLCGAVLENARAGV